MTGPEKQRNIIEYELKRAIMKRSNDTAGLGIEFFSRPGHEKLKNAANTKIYLSKVRSVVKFRF